MSIPSTHLPTRATRIDRELTTLVLARAPKMCNFIEWRDKKVCVWMGWGRWVGCGGVLGRRKHKGDSHPPTHPPTHPNLSSTNKTT